MIGAVLKELRQSKGYTIAQLCNAIEMNTNTYAKYERGERDVSTEILSRFANFYGVSADYLLGIKASAIEPLDQLEKQFDMSALEKKIVDNYLSLPKELRTDLMDFLKKSVNEVMNEENAN